MSNDRNVEQTSQDDSLLFGTDIQALDADAPTNESESQVLQDDTDTQTLMNEQSAQENAQISEETIQSADSNEPQRSDPIITVLEDNTEEDQEDSADGALIGGGDSKVEDIVNLGQFAWAIIKDNQPVVNQQIHNASAIPQIASWGDMGDWSPEPKTMKIHFHTDDIFDTGLNPTDITITCEWYFNGKFNNNGQYINSAIVYATIDAAWGCTYQLNTSFENPMSINGIAVLPLHIILQESNVAQNRTFTWSGQIKGNGAGYLRFE